MIAAANMPVNARPTYIAASVSDKTEAVMVALKPLSPNSKMRRRPLVSDNQPQTGAQMNSASM
ncbi:MAG: hypothetical protein Q8O82_07885 [Pseudorhodobacter sp.]|nr:hypothetical protein [Pseudorhodobacter sp.]